MTPAQQQREITRQAREMAAAQKAAERERKAAGEGRSATRPRRSSGRSTTAIRTGGRVVTSRLGQDIIRGVFGTLFGGKGKEPADPDRRDGPGSTRSGGAAREAWIEADARRRSAAASAGRSSSRTSGRGRPRCASRPTAAPSGSRRPGPGRRTKVRCSRSSARAWASSDVAAAAGRPPDRPWLLFDDGGPTLRATPSGRHAATTTSPRGSGSCPSTPRSSARSRARRHVDAMLAAGVPDGRPERLPGSWLGCSRTTWLWARIDGRRAGRGDAARRRPARQPRRRSTAAVAELDAAGIAASIQHDDLHGGNILVGPDGDRFFDWGDAVVAHPFATLTATFNSIAHHTGRTSATRSSRGCATSTRRPGPIGLPRRRPGAGRRARSRPRLHRPVARLGTRADRARPGRDGRPRRRGRRLADGVRRAARSARRLTR